MNKPSLDVRRYQDELALTRSLLWIGAAGILELFVFLIHRFYIHYSVTAEAVAIAEAFFLGLSFLRIGGAAVTAIGILLALLFLKQGRSITLPTILSLVSMALMTISHVSLTFQATGVQMLFALVPAWGALALLYYIYPREFFLCASMCCFSLMGIWFARVREGLSLEVGLTVLCLVALLAGTLFLKKHDGQVFFGTGWLPYLPSGVSYTTALASGGIGLVLVAASVFLGPAIAYYLLFANAAWLFALLVYYTVKMM